MASCKGFGNPNIPKKAKKNVVIADFSKIKERLKGILEVVLKSLQIKSFMLSKFIPLSWNNGL